MKKQRAVVKSASVGLFGLLAVLLAAVATFAWYSDRPVRADDGERVRDLSGDELIPNPIGSVLGDTPVHWTVKRNGQLFAQRNQTTNTPRTSRVQLCKSFEAADCAAHMAA